VSRLARVFAYGSLMGDNALRFYKGQPARLDGFHRAFNHASTLRWGTPEHPCPLLGLSPGGECWGVAFEVPAGDEREILRKLDRRESGAEYERRKALVEIGEAKVQAWVWTTRPEYADGRRSPDPLELDRALKAAHGIVGTGVEYVRTLMHALELRGIRDPMIEGIWQRLQA